MHEDIEEFLKLSGTSSNNRSKRNNKKSIQMFQLDQQLADWEHILPYFSLRSSAPNFVDFVAHQTTHEKPMFNYILEDESHLNSFC